jgi:hypothetical protein
LQNPPDSEQLALATLAVSHPAAQDNKNLASSERYERAAETNTSPC